MLLNALGYIDFTMNLNKSLMWHVLIGWCIPKGLHPILIEFNFKKKKKNQFNDLAVHFFWGKNFFQ